MYFKMGIIQVVFIAVGQQLLQQVTYSRKMLSCGNILLFFWHSEVPHGAKMFLKHSLCENTALTNSFLSSPASHRSPLSRGSRTAFSTISPPLALLLSF